MDGGSGDSDETSQLTFGQVYDELKLVARKQLRAQPAGHTLQPTALVNEAWLRLGQRQASYNGRTHFFAAAAKAMRHVLVDHARAKRAEKRGGALERVTLLDTDGADGPALDVLDLDEALRRMAEDDERRARVVELKFFTGLTIPEIAEALGVSHMTITNDWRRARARLSRELGG